MTITNYVAATEGTSSNGKIPGATLTQPAETGTARVEPSVIPEQDHYRLETGTYADLRPDEALFAICVDDPYSIEKAVEMGITAEMIPDPLDVRIGQVWDFFVQYWEESDRTLAPSIDVLKATDVPRRPESLGSTKRDVGSTKSYYNTLQDYIDIDFDHPPDVSVAWVARQLKGLHLRHLNGNALWDISHAMYESPLYEQEKITRAAFERWGELVRSTDSDEMRTWTAAELAAESTDFDWLVQGLLAAPTYGTLAGAQKSLKSYISSIVMVGLASGRPIFDTFAADH